MKQLLNKGFKPIKTPSQIYLYRKEYKKLILSISCIRGLTRFMVSVHGKGEYEKDLCTIGDNIPIEIILELDKTFSKI